MTIEPVIPAKRLAERFFSEDRASAGEAVMHHFPDGTNDRRFLTGVRLLVAGLLVFPGAAVLRADDHKPPATSTGSAAATAQTSVSAQDLADSMRELKEQMQALRSQMSEMKENEKHAKEESRELRRELCLTKAKIGATTAESCEGDSVVAARELPSSTNANASALGGAAQQPVSPERITKLEEDQQLTESKLNDQYQTKIESGSKYRVRLSGIVLLNLYGNRGVVDNQDFPGIAREQKGLDSGGAFGGTLRQSQISLQAFGPDVAGAHTSADLKFDFAGGFPNKPNGVAEGLVRLRTGTVRIDWGNTTLIGGQDRLFFVPLAPTSIATLAEPALSYAGSLWAWTPQLRVEHRHTLTEGSSLLIQAGILDSLSGDSAGTQNYREPSVGEQSGQPAYATRVAWTGHVFGQELTTGFGGYYGRQYWGFDRHISAWAGTTDLKLPLGKYFEFTGAFYRGRAVGGLRGGIGQGVLWMGSLSDPATAVKGFDSMGGWTQLKFKAKPNFEINGAFGQDNPFAYEVRDFPTHTDEYDQFLVRNRSAMVNFIWQPRSDFLFSVEYRRLRATEAGGDSYFANHMNLSLGYIF